MHASAFPLRVSKQSLTLYRENEWLGPSVAAIEITITITIEIPILVRARLH